MRLLWGVNHLLAKDEMKIEANQYNSHLQRSVIDAVQTAIGRELLLINEQNNRRICTQLNEIEAVQSIGAVCQAILTTGSNLTVPMRLYQLNAQKLPKMVQINQSTIFNLQHLAGFESAPNARIRLIADSQREYLVSRVYAQKIRRQIYEN